MPLFSPPDNLFKRLDEIHARTRPVLAAMGEQHAREHDEYVKHLKQLLAARAKNLEQQLNTPEPRPLKFNAQGIANVTGWKPKLETDATVEVLKQPNGSAVYWIACGPSGHCVASWRAKVLL